MSWATQCKIAIASKDPQAIIAAFEANPPIETLSADEMKELHDYLEQGIEILKAARGNGARGIERMKKVRQFLKTASEDNSSSI